MISREEVKRPLIPAVGYCRFSSNNQREESIDAQKRAIRFYAQQEGYDIIRFYEDRAVSAKQATKRPAFMQMMEDSASGNFKVVLVHKLDRFSRDLSDSFSYEAKLKDHGVELVSVMERLDSSPSGNLMKAILAGINSFYSQNLAIEVFKGLKENAYQCLTTGGKPCLGYDFVDKKYVVNQHEAKAVQLIFELYSGGHGYNTITRKLNALGYTTKRGNPFGKNSLFDLLHNPRYKGEYCYNETMPRKRDGSRGRRHKPEEEIIRIPGGVPAIVSEEIWQVCQDRMANNKRRGGSFIAKECYLLSGLVFCSECGGQHVMCGNGRYPAPNRPKLVTYRCSHRQMTGMCKNKEIKRDDLEAFVLEELQHQLCNEQMIPHLTQQLNEYICKQADSSENITVYQERMKELEGQRKNIIEAVTLSGLSSAFAAKLQDIEQEIAEVHRFIEQAKNEPIDTISEEQVSSYLASFKEIILKGDKPKIKMIINTLVERVDVGLEEVSVTFKLSIPDAVGQKMGFQFSEHSTRTELKEQVA